MVLIFKNKAIADSLLFDIGATEFGIIMWAGQSTPDFDFDSPINIIPYVYGNDGRVAITPYCSDLDREWIEAYLSDEIALGNVSTHDEWPVGWTPKEVQDV